MEQLSYKQHSQFVLFCTNAQSYLPHQDKMTFMDLLEIAYNYCLQMDWKTKRQWYKEKLEKFHTRHYPKGVKLGKGNLKDDHLKYIDSVWRPRFANNPLDACRPYREIERVAFLMTARACYKYLTNQNEDAFFSKLDEIRSMYLSH